MAATTHSQEGLNVMTYNRCVGTRYCSNNCPYKVRRFNFFDYNRGTLSDEYMPNLLRQPMTELLKMQKNPEVTVRMRGVMEKCTYCVQRIENVRIAAKREADRADPRRRNPDRLPADLPGAGDRLRRPERPEQPRLEAAQAWRGRYGMLDDELNTKPRTRYLARVRNPAPELKSDRTGTLNLSNG